MDGYWVVAVVAIVAVVAVVVVVVVVVAAAVVKLMLRDRVPLAMNRAGAAESNVIGLGQWIDALNSNPFGANAAEGKWRRWKRWKRWKRPSFAPLDSTFNSMG